MLLIYEPEDGERQEFPFQLERLMSPEAEALEDIGGGSWTTFEEFAERLSAGGIRARRALLWVMLRRQNPQLRFSDLVVRVDEVSFGVEDQDRDAARRLLAERTDLPAEERAQLEALIEDDDVAVIASLPDVGELGKEPSDAESTASP